MFVSVVIPVWNGERSHSIYTSLHTDRIPLGLEMGYRIRSLLFGDLRLSEDAEHCKSLDRRRGRRQRPVYLGFAVIFIRAALYDSLELHETFGERIAEALGLRPFAGLRPVIFGELIFWAAAGVFLLALAYAGIAGSTGRDRANGILLLGALAALAVFAVGVDMMNAKLEHAFCDAGLLLTVLEEGGQQITLSLTCGLAILIRREIRNRYPAGTARG